MYSVYIRERGAGGRGGCRLRSAISVIIYTLEYISLAELLWGSLDDMSPKWTYWMTCRLENRKDGKGGKGGKGGTFLYPTGI